MLELSRTVRFFLNDPSVEDVPAAHNTFAAWPPPRGLGRFYQLHVRCAGEADTVTGLFINIRRIDQAVREHGLKCLRSALSNEASSNTMAMGGLLTAMIQALQPPLDSTVHELRLDLSPYHSLAIRSTDMDHVILTQQYEFAAGHRLQVAQFSEHRNQELFGSCHQPSGHGHNYRVDVTVCAPMQDDGSIIHIDQIDALVNECVTRKLDHKNLNTDVPEFSSLNPSVENITKVIFGMLVDRIAELGVKLEAVSVWETSKTVCTYRGETTTV